MRDSFVQASRVGQWPVLVQFPFAEGVICLGFFIVYLLEELGERLMTNDHSGESKDEIKKQSPDDPKSQVLLDKVKDSSSDEEGHEHHHGHSHGPMLSDQHSVSAAIRGPRNYCLVNFLTVCFII